MLRHQLFLRDQEDQELDKEVKILMDQVYLVVTRHQYHPHKVILEEQVVRHQVIDHQVEVVEQVQLVLIILVIMQVQVV
tara:strand:- start:197 stop:433 length:237 start_codon:yes stop_codon:yes gene_type:complete